MLTKTTIVLIGALIIGSAPALAGQANRNAPTVPDKNWASDAYAYSTNGRMTSTPPRHVFALGQDQGTDPDPLVRLELLRDPPRGGGM